MYKKTLRCRPGYEQQGAVCKPKKFRSPQYNSRYNPAIFGTGGIAIAGILPAVVVKKDLEENVARFSSIPLERDIDKEKEYGKFKKGDVIRRTNRIGNSESGFYHYGIYMGTDRDGCHLVFDTHATYDPQTGKTSMSAEVGLRRIDESTRGLAEGSVSAWEVDDSFYKTPKESRDKTLKNISTINTIFRGSPIKVKLSLDDDNCETLARAIVSDAPLSKQAQSLFPLTRFFVNSALGAKEFVDALTRVPSKDRKFSVTEILERVKQEKREIKLDSLDPWASSFDVVLSRSPFDVKFPQSELIEGLCTRFGLKSPDNYDNFVETAVNPIAGNSQDLLRKELYKTYLKVFSPSRLLTFIRSMEIV